MVECELPPRPEEVVGTDVFTFQNELYVVLIDYYSRWIEALPIRTQTSGAVIRVMKDLFACFGIPSVIRSDNGPCYASREFQEFAEAYGFTQATSSPRYPASNGLAEGAVKIIKRLWSKTEDKSCAIAAYRTTPLINGFTPSELMFGIPVRSTLGTCHDSDVDYNLFEKVDKLHKRKIKSNYDSPNRKNTR